MTLEETMTSFLGLEIEQGPQGIDVHLDTYIQEAIDEYGTYFKKPLKPKKVPMQPGVVLLEARMGGRTMQPGNFLRLP